MGPGLWEPGGSASSRQKPHMWEDDKHTKGKIIFFIIYQLFEYKIIICYWTYVLKIYFLIGENEILNFYNEIVFHRFSLHADFYIEGSFAKGYFYLGGRPP